MQGLSKSLPLVLKPLEQQKTSGDMYRDDSLQSPDVQNHSIRSLQFPFVKDMSDWLAGVLSVQQYMQEAPEEQDAPKK